MVSAITGTDVPDASGIRKIPGLAGVIPNTQVENSLGWSRRVEREERRQGLDGRADGEEIVG